MMSDPKQTNVDMEDAAAAIATRRAVLDWRDKHSINATLALSRTCRDIAPDIDERLAAITWRSALVEPDIFITREIDPYVAKAVDHAARQVMIIAQRDLDALVEYGLLGEHGVSPMLVGRRTAADAIDLIASIAPFIGGVGVAAAVPGMAVVTGTAFFGLVATAAVNAPILVGGMTIAGIGIATGALQTARIKDKRTARMRARVAAHLDAAVLSTRPDQPSVLARLHAAIEAATATILKGLAHDR